ncbi:MAG: hypothetical protein KJO49_11260 [Bacteroidia bacterium]|nr:hypothetical protein [Bacteroidia bacterium]MBT8268316.1 hypothetical protein [Bacteroidia bacterium]NNL80565.1 hypothetical protein [Flavobacteriaceae bacterium]
MRFTRYYSKLIRTQGVPQLSVDQHARLMNIISLEGRLAELESIKKSLQDSNQHYQYDVRIFRVQLQLKGLTGDQYPKDVLNHMVYLSESSFH